MRKAIAVIIIITMLLAAGIAAEADPDIRSYQYVRFTHNMDVCSSWSISTKTGTVVGAGSVGYVERLKTDNSRQVWALVRLSEYGTEGNYSSGKSRYWGGWVECGGLTRCTGPLNVWYAKGGFGGDGATPPGSEGHQPGDVYDDPSCNNHVKATASVWLHKTYGLSQNYGKALKKGQKVKYRHKIGIDKRGVAFYAVRYEGKCLWVSSKYSKRVKLAFRTFPRALGYSVER